MKEIDVNKDICIGCGACQQISEAFEIDADGLAKAVNKTIDSNLVEDAIDASECCPVGAITVKDKEN